jgi:magnesium transporter
VDKKVGKSRITVLDYDASGFLEKEVASVEECSPFKESSTVTWINVVGVQDAAVIAQLGALFEIHPLVLEDIMATTQRPKIEDLGTAVFVVLRKIESDPDGLEMRADQLSLVFGPNLRRLVPRDPRRLPRSRPRAHPGR